MTPEIISEYTAKIASGCSVIDGFCGSGGNVIQFSKYCKKVFAIDIDEKKLEICKNNCKIYNCPDNISFIHTDFLLSDKYEKEKIQADYIFLSPPWGGVKYKNSDVYCIKALMSPSIYDIIKMSLKVAKKIMFFLPRTLLLEELFEIISEINKVDRLFFDVHILKSANKIKALLIIFGYDINSKLTPMDIENYITNYYSKYNITLREVKILRAIAKIIGNFRFFKNETEIRKEIVINHHNNIRKNSEIYHLLSKEDLGNEVIKYFFSKILTEQEKIKLKSLNIYNPKNMLNLKDHIIKKEDKTINYINHSSLSTNASPTSSGSNSSENSIVQATKTKCNKVLEKIREISFQIILN